VPINPLSEDEDQTGSSGGQQSSVPTNPISGGTAQTAPIASTNTGGQNASVGGGGTGGSGGQGKPSSTGFTNVNQYVNANADQAAGLGSNITQQVNNQAAQGLQGLNQAQSDFSNQVNAQSANPNTYSAQNVYNTINSDVNAAGNNTSGTTPTNVQSDINQYNTVGTEANNFANGTSTAPQTLTSVASYTPAASQLNTAEQLAQLAGTESGRAQLLQGGTIQSTNPNNPNAQINITGGFAQPNYTTGQVNLDQLLTQNVPQNAQAISTLQNNLLGQYGLANTENQAIQNAAQQYQTASAGTQQAEQNIQDVLYGVPTNAQGQPVYPTDANGNPILPTGVSLTNPSDTVGGGVTINPTTNTPAGVTNPNNVSIQNPNNPISLTGGNASIQNPNTPISGPGTNSTPQQVQYGVLSNLYNQLNAAPTAQNAQQAQNIAQQTQQLTNYLTQQYGTSIGGVPVATLAANIVTPQSAVGSASLTNTMTPQQLAQLQTLNQFAGLGAANENQVGQTGGANTTQINPAQVGTNTFNAGVTDNMSSAQQAVQQAINSQVQAVNAGLNNIQNPGAQTIPTAYGNQSVPTAISNINQMLAPNSPITKNLGQGSWEGASSQLNSINQSQATILAQINQVRQANGLQGISLPPQPAGNSLANTQNLLTYTQNLQNLIQSNLQATATNATNIPVLPSNLQVNNQGVLAPLLTGPGPQLK
jgi:hypothetical protein